MILLLLTRFCESADLLGFQLCQILVQQGHHLYVTTTSSGDALHEEIKNASHISTSSRGSITVFSPEHGEHAVPSVDWITKYHDKYFSYLSKIDDIKTVIGMFPGTEETAVAIKEALRCSLVLVASEKMKTSEEDLQNLNAVLSKSDELWSIGSDVYNHINSILQQSGATCTKKHKELLLPSPGRTISVGNVLVLLSRFAECEESRPAFLLCTKLAKSGHHVYATTTAICVQLETEIERAKQLTEKYIGRIQLLQPEYRYFEEPSPKWIQNLPKQYFSYLSNYKVDCVFGTLPGTAQTAVELKESLKCKVILLLSCKLGSSEPKLRSEIIKCAVVADEVWSMGSDMYTYYENIFGTHPPQIRHQEIVLLPEIYPTAFLNQHQKLQMSYTPGALVSIWSPPIEFFHYGIKEYSQGSEIKKYYALSSALGEINAACTVDKVQWNIHGLEKNDHKSYDIQNHARPNKLKVNPRRVITCTDTLLWANCLALIVPDLEEETFNFFALTAIWLGILTLVSSQSSIGKFLQSVPCSEKSRAVVNLTGDHERDAAQWKQKISTEVLSTTAYSQQWAETLSRHVQMKIYSCEPDFSNVKSFQKPRDRHRANKWAQDHVEPRFYVEEKKLGYFATEEEKSNVPTEAQIGDLKRFASTRSVGGDSAATFISATSRMSGLSHGISQWYLPNIVTSNSGPVEFISSTHVKIFEGSALKAFSNAFFSDNTLWISGWCRNWFRGKTIILLNVGLPEYNVLRKGRKLIPNADIPAIMVPFDDKIIFTMTNETEVFSFHPETSTFKTIYSRPNLKVAAMCAVESHAFLLNQKELGFIQVFNTRFYREENIATGLSAVEDCSIDICVLKSPSYRDHNAPSDYTIVISTSSPHGSVRAVSKQGQLWVVDGATEPLDTVFSPYSVSSSANGGIFVVDQDNNLMYTISSDGSNIEVLLDKDNGIRGPTRVAVDEEGTRLAIINRDSKEIRNYKINKVFLSEEELQESPSLSDDFSLGSYSLPPSEISLPSFTGKPRRAERSSYRSLASFNVFHEGLTGTRSLENVTNQGTNEIIVLKYGGSPVASAQNESNSQKRETLRSLENIILDFLHRKVTMVKIVKGEPCTVQGPNSDIILHVPRGVHGAIVANVHTNNARFIHHIRQGDCLVSPVCEYHIQPSLYKSSPHLGKFKIQIPHIIKDVDKVRPHIRIWDGNIHSGVPPLKEEKSLLRPSDGMVQHDIDEKYVTIYTSHFSGFIVTAEAINCCAHSASVLLFGSLRNVPRFPPLATVKVFLSSTHSFIKDYESDLERIHGMCENSLRLLKNNEIDLSTETYDASKSKVKITLVPVNLDTWKSDGDNPVEKALNKALKFEAPFGRICKLNPTEVHEFYMESSQAEEPHFRTKVHVEKLIVIQSDDNPHNNTENQSKHLFVIDMTDSKLDQDQSASLGTMNRADTKLLRLSKRLSTNDDLRRLAIDGLKMETHEVQKHIQNHPHDINTASHNTLSEWRNAQINDTVAFANLRKALERVGMVALIKETQ